MSAAARAGAWLFSPSVDLAVFAGSALVSVAFVLAAPWLGVGDGFPAWAFLLFVVCIDVAHVWSTLWRVYLDPEEVRRRAALYLGVPIAAYALGFAAYQASPGTFWRLFAYAALFHFVRQQYGWVALYNRKGRATDFDRRLDAAAVYAATVGPALWWHANLPRPFWWFVEGDFAPLPAVTGPLALGAHFVIMGAWVLRQLHRAWTERSVAVGKCCVVLATWVTWYGGIVLATSDFAFTVTNVVLHGVPYFALLYRYALGRQREGGYGAVGHLLRLGVPGFLLLLLLLAYFEELLWDRFVWRDHPELFGGAAPTVPDAWLAALVPLLALPQATHYLLDAFIWKAGRDPALLARLGWKKTDDPEQRSIPNVDKPEPSWL